MHKYTNDLCIAFSGIKLWCCRLQPPETLHLTLPLQACRKTYSSAFSGLNIHNKGEFVDCFQQNPTIFNFSRRFISKGFRLIDKPVRCLSLSVYVLLQLIQADVSTLAALERIFPAHRSTHSWGESMSTKHTFKLLGLRNDKRHSLVSFMVYVVLSKWR